MARSVQYIYNQNKFLKGFLYKEQHQTVALLIWDHLVKVWFKHSFLVILFLGYLFLQFCHLDYYSSVVPYGVTLLVFNWFQSYNRQQNQKNSWILLRLKNTLLRQSLKPYLNCIPNTSCSAWLIQVTSFWLFLIRKWNFNTNIFYCRSFKLLLILWNFQKKILVQNPWRYAVW